MSDIAKAVIGFVIVGVIGVILLGYGGGFMPLGFGLFDQSQWSVRIVTLVVLVVVAVLLGLWYRSSTGSKEQG